MKSEKKYLTALGAWALAFGCSVGWGAFVMPGGTFLPIAGPVGSALGLCIGGAVMLILAVNYGYLMNRFPDSGGTYSYTKTAFGYDHGFLSAWFLILTYVAIIWANATALPLIARTVLGGTFQFGFDYEIAGFHVWFGEILLAVGSLVLAALICLYRKRAERWQIVMAMVLLGGVVICFIAAMLKADGRLVFQPPFAPGAGEFGGTFTIFALAPWAYVGFESISHSAAEARFDLRRSFRIMAAAVICAAAAYSLLVLLAVTALPEGCADWTDYVGRLGSFDGLAAQPTFHAAGAAMGRAGVVLLSAAAFGGIVTGLIGNYVALSRLLCALSDDGMFPKWLGVKDRNLAPRRAILCILGVSLLLPFLGRTAI
ncbi:MAG: APC family permease, partial [Oscillospiraceae bacterium]|nr:APC family permease [Oscillospiraceae bacterium]